MSHPLDFQSIIFTLQRFWAEQGCLIWQPYYAQVGAGTNNPATFLRVLGPEPWNVGYVEPSIRPDDARYGENPYRLQQHYQFQVILKPDPGDPQEMYLRSLEALGIDPRQHDIRFVEDNWESPALGMWGLGWEVWLDGQEITQFTYFQQAGGNPLNPVSVEITYGLERIAMPLQRVRHFRDIQWSKNIKYGDVNYQGEYEHSKYYFEIAGVERLRQMFDLYESEARSALEQGLVLPAYDNVLHCSHTFNVLDTRGAIGVTERQAFFRRMRDLSRRVTEAYLEQRQRLAFPWLVNAVAGQSRPVAALALPTHLETAPFVLEIGAEELPAADLQSAIEQLQSRVPQMLADLRLQHGTVQVMGTPRRLVVLVDDLAPRQRDQETIHRGPPASRAFDAAGLPTKAAEGFARSKGLDVSTLEVQEIEGGSYVVARIYETGRSVIEALSQALPELIASIRFDKSMRWNASNVPFSRPIRWLLALFGEHVVPFEYAGLQSAAVTRGLRFHAPAEISVSSRAGYLAALENQGILLDPAARKAYIASRVKQLMLAAGADPRIDESLLEEVTHLVEAPCPLRGAFDAAHLDLPEDVLVSVMKKYQRYFPLFDRAGKLLPYFIAVRNGDDRHLDVVADGNEQVIRARFADAAFFIEADLKHPLEEYLPRLSTLTFQFNLGSMLDKSRRIAKLTAALAPQLGLSEGETTAALRAAALCKADLVSHMVIEMTALQGTIGRYYALHSGESHEVAEAIFEHYLPRQAGDRLPAARPGLVVGLADRLDSLVGLFAAGLAPSGTRDPFALRRAALGLVQNLIAWDLPFDLRQALSLAAANLPFEASPPDQTGCLDFIIGRMRGMLIEAGGRYDIVDAVLAAQAVNPAGAARAVHALSAWTRRPDWPAILQAYARCVRITRDQMERFTVQPQALSHPEELTLFQALLTAENLPRQPGSVDSLFTAFLPLIPAINRFFDAVLVMEDDLAIRQNRLGLLQRIASLASGVVDLSRLEGF
ncbi:MAG TPA: glycine--tRNA ligase subunit beta [Levilinea sp.]|nr:glycine--tRNA ligase subunit beta [Levilinea sp.]